MHYCTSLPRRPLPTSSLALSQKSGGLCYAFLVDFPGFPFMGLRTAPVPEKCAQRATIPRGEGGAGLWL